MLFTPIEKQTARVLRLGCNQLKSSKKTLTFYKNGIEKKDKEAYKEVLEQITTATKKIDHLLDSYLGAVDKRQGIVRNPENSVLRRISNASRYVRSRPTGITSTEEKLLEHLHNDLNVDHGCQWT